MSYPLIMNPMKKRYLGAVYRMKDRREQGQKKGESGGKPKGRSKRMDDRGGVECGRGVEMASPRRTLSPECKYA